MGLEKIHHLIRYIEDHYHEELSIEKLEDLSNYSYRNVQRIFKSIFNESIGAFQKRLKLENGYKKLIYSRQSITDIAYSVGFESLHSFSKSFKKQFQLSPEKARKEKEGIFEGFIKNTSEEKKTISYELVFLKQLKVFYLGAQAKDYELREIDQLWDRIDEAFDDYLNVQYYGIIVDQPLITEKIKCRYEACIDQDPQDQAFSSTYIFGARYAKYVHNGSFDLIEDTYRQIYKDWLFHAALEFDNTPMIEHYLKNEYHTENPEDYVTEILVPIKK
ncbi:AraC family transcriptional regulator [Pedobacter gandavensis]|uniref:AraC family transcriptional regulator n=1 Tax=Pedobacter gandavensis TaxID=2679963 RepID=UPI00292CF92B|nr:AraC family transcriptional regulator [Pedobacter gandavensis]